MSSVTGFAQARLAAGIALMQPTIDTVAADTLAVHEAGDAASAAAQLAQQGVAAALTGLVEKPIKLEGQPSSSLAVVWYRAQRSEVYPAGLAGCALEARIGAAAATVFTLCKNDVSFGTATFAAGSRVAVFASAADATFAAGDVFTLIAPATPDSALEDLRGVLSFSR